MSAALGAGFRERIAADLPVQAIAFELGGETHACDVLLVEEVVTGRRIHPLPDMPPRLLGVVRLRGELIPVIDVAPLLSLALDRGRLSTILVLEADERRVGVAADYVRDVVTFPPGVLRPAPGSDAYVAAVAHMDGTLYTLVDLAEILREQTTLSPREPT
ncbi:MAG: purine-binding chemotaxis protein CheW [Gemmatimonadetes bacterium]|nr:purine-binding chemotaxis protein CheW [Gemmatimonadota bacterium]